MKLIKQWVTDTHEMSISYFFRIFWYQINRKNKTHTPTIIKVLTTASSYWYPPTIIKVLTTASSYWYPPTIIKVLTAASSYWYPPTIIKVLTAASSYWYPYVCNYKKDVFLFEIASESNKTSFCLSTRFKNPNMIHF
jgi:hypothetical protein